MVQSPPLINVKIYPKNLSKYFYEKLNLRTLKGESLLERSYPSKIKRGGSTYSEYHCGSHQRMSINVIPVIHYLKLISLDISSFLFFLFSVHLSVGMSGIQSINDSKYYHIQMSVFLGNILQIFTKIWIIYKFPDWELSKY